MAIASEDSFYILRFHRDTYNAKVEDGAEVTDEGSEEVFEVVDVSDKFLPNDSLHVGLHILGSGTP